MSHLQAIRDQVNLEWRRTNDDKWNEAIECAVAIIDQYMAAKPSPPALDVEVHKSIEVSWHELEFRPQDAPSFLWHCYQQFKRAHLRPSGDRGNLMMMWRGDLLALLQPSSAPEVETEDYRNAPSGVGPHASTWEDKPHRLVYDLCNEVQRLRLILAAQASVK